MKLTDERKICYIKIRVLCIINKEHKYLSDIYIHGKIFAFLTEGETISK